MSPVQIWPGPSLCHRAKRDGTWELFPGLFAKGWFESGLTHQMTKNPAARILFAIAALIGLGILLITLDIPWGLWCSFAEQRAFNEFPHFNGIPLKPQHNSFSCWGAYDTSASYGDVVQHYQQQLEAHGWRQVPDSNDLLFTRNGFGYSVSFEVFETETHVAVRVWKY